MNNGNRQSSSQDFPRQHGLRLGLSVIVLAIMLAFAGCEGSKTDTAANQPVRKDPNHAELFNLRPEQMSHVQVVTVQPTALTRTLRLTGAVAYNSFRTTPVITQVSGPVSRVVVVPGQKVRQGQPMLYVASPDYSQLRTNYLKARDAYSLAQKTYARAQDLYQHHAIAVKDLEQAESAEVQAGGDLASAEAALKVMGVTDPEALAKARRPTKFRCERRSAGKWLNRWSLPGNCCSPAIRNASRFPTPARCGCW